MSTRFRLRRADGQVYLGRWGWECRWGGLFVHKMTAPDPGVDLHDHPWPFGSFILWGGYWEEREPVANAVHMAQTAEHVNTLGPHYCPRGYIRRRSWLSWKTLGLHEAHRITGLFRKTSWSLVIHGRKRTDRKWGFFEPTGFVASHDYSTKRRDMWAEAA